MWMIALLCGFGTLPDKPEPELSPAWKAVPLVVVHDDGTQRTTNVFDFCRSRDEHGELLEQALREASREVPEDDMELFVQGLLTPSPGLTDETVDLSPRARWYVHPDQPDLFRLQVEDLKQFVRGEAFAFGLWPPLEPVRHKRVVSQINRLFAEAEAQARHHGFDMDQVKHGLADARRWADQSLNPAATGWAIEPSTDEKMEQQLQDIRAAFEMPPTPREEAAFVRDLLLKTIYSLERPTTVDDPELQDVYKKLCNDIGRAATRRWEREWRVATTRPALIPSVTIHRAADRPSSQPATTQPATRPASRPAAHSELAPELWEAIELTYITGEGRRVDTNLPEFRASHGEKGRALFDAVTAAAHAVPPKRLPLFIEGLALPGFGVDLFSGELQRVPRAQWEVHPTDDPLFDAEVQYLEAFVAVEAAVFLAGPPLDDEPRAKLADQLVLVFEEIRQQCTRYDFDRERADAAIQLFRSIAEESAHPARYGAILEPQTDKELATIVDRIQKAFKPLSQDRSGALNAGGILHGLPSLGPKATRVGPTQEEAFVYRVSQEALDAFRGRPVLLFQFQPDSPQGKLRKALDEAREHRLRLERARVTTRPGPAATSRPSQEPASSTSPTAPTPASRQAATRPASP